MRVGTLCFATDQGLGVLAKQFYDHGIVSEVRVVRHGRHPTHEEWYPGAVQVTDLRDRRQRADTAAWVESLDFFLAFETPFWWELFDTARSAGVRTALMPMHECTPEGLPGVPDAFLCPSLLDLECFVSDPLRPQVRAGKPPPFLPWDGAGAFRCYWTPVPAPCDPGRDSDCPCLHKVPWRLRERAEVFVHNAGHGGLRGRNGTREFLEALRYVQTPVRVVLRSQESIANRLDVPGHVELTWREGTTDYAALYDAGDVFVFPEKFNGLSLPLQEARAAGLLVLATDRFPVNTWLPRWLEFSCTCKAPSDVWAVNVCSDPCLVCRDTGRYPVPALIPIAGSHRTRVGPPYREFEEVEVSSQEIARLIDRWHGRDVRDYSLAGREWAVANSWKVWGPSYRALLEELVAS